VTTDSNRSLPEALGADTVATEKAAVEEVDVAEAALEATVAAVDVEVTAVTVRVVVVDPEVAATTRLSVSKPHYVRQNTCASSRREYSGH